MTEKDESTPLRVFFSVRQLQRLGYIYKNVGKYLRRFSTRLGFLPGPDI